ADCVALGTHLYSKIDVVLSGINLGPNLGNSMWHSGTLAAAKQAVLLGIKGIAFSTPVGKSEPDFSTIEPYVAQVLELLLPTEGLSLFNVNFPQQPTAIRWTRQSVSLYDGKIVPGMDPMGRKHYWFTVTPLEPAESDTDRWAVENGFVSITPLRLDLTNEQELAERRKQTPAGTNR
ncbi:MAG: 5'/3'-nucleotidase SurE, partial [Flavisolibacter sp.]